MNTIHVMVGLPGSGKSFTAKMNFPDAILISSDGIREELFGAEEVQRNPARVFHFYYKRAQEALDNGYDVVLDATNLSRKDRKRIFTLFGEQAFIVAEVMDTPFEKCLARNAARARVVPEKVIRDMSVRYQVPTYEEGFDMIYFWEEDGFHEMVY